MFPTSGCKGLVEGEAATLKYLVEVLARAEVARIWRLQATRQHQEDASRGLETFKYQKVPRMQVNVEALLDFITLARWQFASEGVSKGLNKRKHSNIGPMCERSRIGPWTKNGVGSD